MALNLRAPLPPLNLRASVSPVNDNLTAGAPP